MLLLLTPSGAWCQEGAPCDWPNELVWERLFEAIELAEVRLTRPRPVAVYALRVDLSRGNVTPVTDSDNGERPEETDGLKTSTFLTKTDSLVAINGAPFWPGVKQEGQPQNVVGLVVSGGELVSPVDAARPRAALVFRSDGAASIETPPIELDGVVTAVGGYGRVLRGGEVIRPLNEDQQFIDDFHPRTAIGLANDGQVLLMVAIDGRQPGYSEGVSLGELGQILRLLGADEGLNLDGGGTTTMAAADATSGFRLINQPIDGGMAGQERVSASHLGIRRRQSSP